MRHQGFAIGRMLRLLAAVIAVAIGGAAGGQGATDGFNPAESVGVLPARDAPQVLLLHSYHQGLAWADSVVLGARSALVAAPTRAEVHVEYLDMKRYPRGAHLEELARALRAKYGATRWGAVLTADDDAFRFAIDRRDSLFPGVPVVFCGLNHYETAVLDGQPNVTGVVESFSLEKTLDIALRLHPDTREVHVVNDLSLTGKGNAARLDQITPRYPAVRFVHLDSLTMDELEERLRQLPQRSIVLLMNWNIDRAGRVFDHLESADRVRAASVRPIYGFQDMYLGHGIVGGFLTSAVQYGRDAGQLAAQVLKQGTAEGIAVRYIEMGRHMFDAGEMRRFGLERSALPLGSIVVDTHPSFYEAYRPWIWSVLGFMLLQTAVIVAFAVTWLRRRRAEAELRAAKESLELAMRGGEVLLWSYDHRAGMIELHDVVGTLGERGTGMRRSIDDFYDLLIHPDDCAPVRKALEEHIAGRSEQFETEHRMKSSTGEWIWVVGRGKIVERDRSGAPVRLAGTIADITRRKRMEEENLELEEQFRQSQKMEPIGRLAGGVAHDFNNLLTPIIGYAELLLAQHPADSPDREILAEIREAGMRAASLTRQLLAFSRKQVLSMRSIDLNECIIQFSRFLGRLVGEDIEIELRLDPSIALIRADATQIEQILMNLVVNARDAMPGGGKITIETDPGDDGFVQLAVRDHGTGMDDATLSRIFEPFFTTKELGKGTGLGLSTVYGIVRQHGGNIAATSELGSGTSFVIQLPSAVAEAVQPATPAVPTPAPAGARIILVEDEEAVRHLLTNVLAGAGYQVAAFADPAEALERGEKDLTAFDALITDVVLPKMNGRDLFRRLAARRPSLKVLYMSGYSEEVLAGEDAAHLLQKPFGIDEFLARVATLLAG